MQKFGAYFDRYAFFYEDKLTGGGGGVVNIPGLNQQGAKKFILLLVRI